MILFASTIRICPTFEKLSFLDLETRCAQMHRRLRTDQVNHLANSTSDNDEAQPPWGKLFPVGCLPLMSKQMWEHEIRGRKEGNDLKKDLFEYKLEEGHASCPMLPLQI